MENIHMPTVKHGRLSVMLRASFSSKDPGASKNVQHFI